MSVVVVFNFHIKVLSFIMSQTCMNLLKVGIQNRCNVKYQFMVPFRSLSYWLFWVPPSENETKAGTGNERASVVYFKDIVYSIINLTIFFM